MKSLSRRNCGKMGDEKRTSLLAVMLISIFRTAVAQDLSCPDVSVYARVKQDACLYIECRPSDQRQGLRACPPGFSVPPDYTDGSEEFPCSQESLRCGVCNFPENILSPRKWLYGYLLSTNSLYTTEEFTSSMTKVTFTNTVDNLCVDNVMENGVRYGTRLQLVENDYGFLRSELLFYRCMEHVFVDNDLVLQKQGILGFSFVNATTDCKNLELPTVPWYRLLLEYNETTMGFEPPREACPFPDGIYNVSVNTHDGRVGVCDNHTDSTATVTGSEMRVELCDQADNRDNGSYSCHRGLQASDLGESDNSNGNIVIMSKPHPDYSSSSVFFCVRYKVIDDAIYLGVTESTENSLDCAQGARYDSYGDFVEDVDHAVAFTLTGVIPTTSTDIPPTSTSLAEDDQTTIVAPPSSSSSLPMDDLTTSDSSETPTVPGTITTINPTAPTSLPTVTTTASKNPTTINSDGPGHDTTTPFIPGTDPDESGNITTPMDTDAPDDTPPSTPTTTTRIDTTPSTADDPEPSSSTSSAPRSSDDDSGSGLDQTTVIIIALTTTIGALLVVIVTVYFICRHRDRAGMSPRKPSWLPSRGSTSAWAVPPTSVSGYNTLSETDSPGVTRVAMSPALRHHRDIFSSASPADSLNNVTVFPSTRDTSPPSAAALQ